MFELIFLAEIVLGRLASNVWVDYRTLWFSHMAARLSCSIDWQDGRLEGLAVLSLFTSPDTTFHVSALTLQARLFTPRSGAVGPMPTALLLASKGDGRGVLCRGSGWQWSNEGY